MTEKGQKPTAILRKYLATDDLSVEGLMSCSGSALGKLRADRLFELLRFTWLSQRYWGLSIIASLVAGTRLLGEEWWTSKERSPWPLGSDLSIEMSPDEVLFGPDNLMHGRSRVLTHLEYRIAEEVAVQAWGLPIDLRGPEFPAGSGPLEAHSARRLSGRPSCPGLRPRLRRRCGRRKSAGQ